MKLEEQGDCNCSDELEVLYGLSECQLHDRRNIDALENSDFLDGLREMTTNIWLKTKASCLLSVWQIA